MTHFVCTSVYRVSFCKRNLWDRRLKSEASGDYSPWGPLATGSQAKKNEVKGWLRKTVQSLKNPYKMSAISVGKMCAHRFYFIYRWSCPEFLFLRSRTGFNVLHYWFSRLCVLRMPWVLHQMPGRDPVSISHSHHLALRRRGSILRLRTWGAVWHRHHPPKLLWGGAKPRRCTGRLYHVSRKGSHWWWGSLAWEADMVDSKELTI